MRNKHAGSYYRSSNGVGFERFSVGVKKNEASFKFSMLGCMESYMHSVSSNSLPFFLWRELFSSQNIHNLLNTEGSARCLSWSAQCWTQGADRHRELKDKLNDYLFNQNSKVNAEVAAKRITQNQGMTAKESTIHRQTQRRWA